MPNFFETFRDGMGQTNTGPEDNTPSTNQAQVAMDFARARHNSAGTKSAADGTIARPMQNGRHAFSDQVLNAYSVAGVDVDPEVKALTDELDALAVSSQAIAQMDTATRQRYINRGYREFDAAAITEREAELQSMVMDRARNVITENDALDRELKRMAVDRTATSLSAERMSLASAEQEQKYKTATEGMNFDELYDAYQKGGISGVPRAWLANRMQEVGQLEYEARTIKQALTPGAGASALDALMGLGTGAVGQKAGSGSAGVKGLDFEKIAEAIGYQFTGDEIDAMITEFEEKRLSDPKAAASTTGITLPGFGVTVPLPVVLKARQFSTEIASMGVKPDDLRKMNSLNAQLLTAQQNFSDSITQLGGVVNTNSAAQAKVARYFTDARAMLKAGDVAGAEGALNDGVKEADAIVSAMIGTKPKPQQAFLTDIQRFGRPNSPDAVADFLTAEAPVTALERLKPGTPYHEAAQLVFSEMRDFETMANDVSKTGNIMGALVSVDKDAKQKALRDALLDNASVSLYSKHFNAAVGERLASVGMQAALLGKLKELQANAGAMPDQRSVVESAILTKAAETIFGTDWKRGRINKSFYRQFPVTNDAGDPVLDASGSPMEVQLLDANKLIASLAPFQLQLKEAGSDYQLGSAFATGIESNAAALAGELLPGNDPLKQAILYMVDGNYRASPEMDASASAQRMVERQLGVLNSAIDTMQELPQRVPDVIEAARGSEAERRLVRDRASEIIANWSTQYNPEISGIAREKIGDPAAPHNSVQAMRAAQTQAINELKSRARDKSAVIPGTVLRDDRILSEVLKDQ